MVVNGTWRLKSLRLLCVKWLICYNHFVISLCPLNSKALWIHNVDAIPSTQGYNEPSQCPPRAFVYNFSTECRIFSFIAGQLAFQEFLRSEYSEENILFWLACEDYKKSKNTPEMISAANRIYSEFVQVEAPRQVRYWVEGVVESEGWIFGAFPLAQGTPPYHEQMFLITKKVSRTRAEPELLDGKAKSGFYHCFLICRYVFTSINMKRGPCFFNNPAKTRTIETQTN